MQGSKIVSRCQNIETSQLKSNTKLKMNKIVKRDITTENERKSSKKEKERKYEKKNTNLRQTRMRSRWGPIANQNA